MEQCPSMCKDYNSTVLRFRWTNPSDAAVYFKAVDRDFVHLATMDRGNRQLDLEGNIRFSLTRNVLTGRYFIEGYYFLESSQDCAKG